MGERMLRARARKTEKVAWWIVAILAALHIIFLLVKYYELDLASFLIILLIIVILLLVLLRDKPPWNAHDAVALCYKERLKYAFTYLDKSAAEVQPAGDSWLVDFTNDSVVFEVDPKQRYILGFRVKTADEMLAKKERSDILRSVAKERQAKEAERESLAAAGYDTSDLEEKPEGDDE